MLLQFLKMKQKIPHPKMKVKIISQSIAISFAYGKQHNL